MAEQARLLMIFQLAQERFKQVLKMPDQDANRVISSVKENAWNVYGKLKKQYPRLDNERLAERIGEAVRSAFEDRDMAGTFRRCSLGSFHGICRL